MFSLSTVILPIMLAVPALSLPTAPAASCYTSNNNNGIAAIPTFAYGQGSQDPNNIADGPNGFTQACGQSGLTGPGATIPAGYTASYSYSNGDNGGISPSCSDVAGDIRNLAKQCPHGGVLQHMNALGHKGNVLLKQTKGVNQPLPPISWF